MTIKELFKKVEIINKTKKELNLPTDEVCIEVEFDGYKVMEFNSFNQLYAHIDQEYIEEYKQMFFKTELKTDYNYFYMEFNSARINSKVVVNIYNC